MGCRVSALLAGRAQNSKGADVRSNISLAKIYSSANSDALSFDHTSVSTMETLHSGHI